MKYDLYIHKSNYHGSLALNLPYQILHAVVNSKYAMKWYTASRTDIEFCSLIYVISYGHVLPRNLLSIGQAFLGSPHNRLTTTTHYADFKKELGAVTKRYFFRTYSILFQRKSKVVVQYVTFIPIYFYIFIYCLYFYILFIFL